MNSIVPFRIIKPKVESTYDPQAAERVLGYIRMGDSLIAACGQAGVPPSLVKQWSLHHATFPSELEVALALRVSILEKDARSPTLDPTGARIILAALASANPEAWSPPAPQKQVPLEPVELPPNEVTINVIGTIRTAQQSNAKLDEEDL